MTKLPEFTLEGARAVLLLRFDDVEQRERSLSIHRAEWKQMKVRT